MVIIRFDIDKIETKKKSVSIVLSFYIGIIKMRREKKHRLHRWFEFFIWVK